MENPRANSLQYPKDRRYWVAVQPRFLILGFVAATLPLALAWGQFLLFGLPGVPPSPKIENLAEPHGFPVWIRLTHFVNLLFMVLLVRSGLSILFDHPRLYLSEHCTPGSDWIRFTPLLVPTDRIWTAKDDSRYLSPWIGLPGYRHTVGIARYWHFLAAASWLANGLIFVALLFLTNQWKRLVPTDWHIVPDAWSIFVHYATFHLPVEPDGFYRYNPLQQLSYFGVVFVLAPVSVLTGLAMSPAIDSRFRWYPKLFGGRQCARSIHFLALLGYLGFLVPHVGMVVITGFAQNMNHITLGTDDTHLTGLILGAAGLAAIVLVVCLAHWFSWSKPRALQLAFRQSLGRLQRLFMNPLESRAEFSEKDISPYFWPNGKMPECSEWKDHAEHDFRSYRLKITGLVANPVELDLAQIQALGQTDQITMHHCIQGWSGIAHWGGLSLAKLIELAQPLPEARIVVFHSYGEGHYGGPYYDTLSIANAKHHQSILAYQMNHAPLPLVHGAPLRLRAENQLGYKQVKWIREVEFVASETTVGKGFGGKNEDDEYYPVIANI